MIYRLSMEDTGYNWGDQFWKWSEVKIITPITVDNSKNIKWENYNKTPMVVFKVRVQ